MEPPLLAEAPGVTISTLASVAGVRSFVISRDGAHLAWLAPDSNNVTQIVLATLGGGAPRGIPGTEGANALLLAPAAKSVGFSRTGELQNVSVDGGTAAPPAVDWGSCRG